MESAIIAYDGAHPRIFGYAPARTATELLDMHQVPDPAGTFAFLFCCVQYGRSGFGPTFDSQYGALKSHLFRLNSGSASFVEFVSVYGDKV